MVCNSGVGLTPLINGRRLHYSAGGLYNGLVLLIDDETRSYWDHITGKALHGPMAGVRMPIWGVQLTTIDHALDRTPGLLLFRSRQTLTARVLSWFLSRPFARNTMPPGFRKTMGTPDPRLPEMEIGLGVVAPDSQRFYPKGDIAAGIEDNWQGRLLHIRMNPSDDIPYAVFSDGHRPFQLFTRWYGFAYSFPACSIYHAGVHRPVRQKHSR